MKDRTLRKYVHKFVILIILLFLSANLIACKPENTSGNDEQVLPQNAAEDEALGNQNDDVAKTDEENTAAGASITPAEAKDSVSQQAGDETQTDVKNTEREAMVEAYKSALNGIYDNHTFPDGKTCDWDGQSDITKNQFAVYDIDQDAKDELIIEFTTGSLAGMTELIYEFDEDTKTFKEEFREYPALTYYDNGIIKADWSHNQGLAGNFWPYTLYQYDSNTDCYVNIGMVDAWDRSLSEIDNNGSQFPSEIDTDGDGIIYYIMKNGKYELINPVDGIEYNQWIDSYIGNAKETNIPFMSLSEENIDSIQ